MLSWVLVLQNHGFTLTVLKYAPPPHPLKISICHFAMITLKTLGSNFFFLTEQHRVLTGKAFFTSIFEWLNEYKDALWEFPIIKVVRRKGSCWYDEKACVVHTEVTGCKDV